MTARMIRMPNLSMLLLLVLTPACREEAPRGTTVRMSAPVTKTDTTQQTSWLGRYDLSAPPLRRFTLEGDLDEISGLAVTGDGRLFAHDDESAVVYQLDYLTGTILKRFSLGSGFLEEDFEGIAIKQDTMFLVTSDGRILEFQEGTDRGHTRFQLHRTGLRQKNDVEGLEYDPDTDALLLACKGDPGKGFGEEKSVYSFSLSTRTLEGSPRFLISSKDLKPTTKKGSFAPSGIARHPVAGTYFVISANGQSVIELDSRGSVLAQAELPRTVHSQPEGIAFAPDGAMIIANDGQGEGGSLVVHGLIPSEGQ
jgi:uncharacterized protein YjiK